MLTRWSVGTLIIFSNTFWLRFFFWFSDFNFSTLEISNFIFDFHLQWSFNIFITATDADSVICLDTLNFFEHFLTYNFFLIFRLQLFNFGNFKFHFSFSSSMIIQYNGSFNTFITATNADSVIRFDTYNFFEHFLTYNFFDFPTSTFQLWKFQFSFLIFIFNNHAMPWVIQYMHTNARCWLGDPLGHL